MTARLAVCSCEGGAGRTSPAASLAAVLGARATGTGAPPAGSGVVLRGGPWLVDVLR